MRIHNQLRAWLTRHPRAASCVESTRRHRRLCVTLFVLVCHLAGLLTSVHAIMEVRTAQGATAWAVSLNTFPYVAVPAYWVLGRSKFHGYVTARREELVHVQPVAKKFMRTLEERNLIAEPDRDRPMLVEKLAKLPFTAGNDAQLLVNGDATFQSIFEGIAGAKNYVLVQFYIIHDDGVGRELKSRLRERAKAGVRCLVLYDEIGSDLTADYIEELTAAGISARPCSCSIPPGPIWKILRTSGSKSTATPRASCITRSCSWMTSIAPWARRISITARSG